MQTQENANFMTSPKMQETLLAMGTLKEVKEGDTVLQEEAYIKSIPLVIKGSLRVMRLEPDGRQIFLYYIRPGESCIMSFLGGIHQDTSKVKALAEEDTELLMIPVEKLGMLLKEHPQWLEYIFKLYHQRFEELLEVINAVAFKNMDERLLDFIKTKSKLSGSKSIAITHEQLATELGTARVVISRLLKQMEQKGWIRLFRNKIELV